MEVPTTHLRTNDPIKREHRKQSVATRYHTQVQNKDKKALLIEVIIAVILDKTMQKSKK